MEQINYNKMNERESFDADGNKIVELGYWIGYDFYVFE